MKKYLLFIACLFLVSFYACSDDMDDMPGGMMEEDECDGTSYTYTNAIKSIVDSNCALSGCHDGSNERPDFTTYDGISANAGGAASRTAAGVMPPAASGISLTEDQILMIKCWAESGAPQ